MSERNFDNRTLYHGDNLPFLRGMNSGTVNLIATDPPFNKNNEFHSTPDALAAGASFQDRWRWDRDIHDDWLTAIMRDEPEVWAVINTAKQVWGDDMGAFLCWLGVRLMEMHRILADDGSIYLHIDHTAHAYVKTLMDAIFGRKNFRNEIVWNYRRWPATSRDFQRMHDMLLRYSKSECWTWNQLYEPLAPSTLKADGGRKILNVFTKDGKRVRGAKTGEKSQGALMRSVWDIGFLSPTAKERTGYPTQKPLALYERIILASSNEGDMVLDPFAGCATTPVAAERLGRQWVGIDIWDGAHEQVLDRLVKEKLAVKGRPTGARKGGSPVLLTFGDITYSTTPPMRTDSGEPATLILRTPTGKAPRHPSPRTRHADLLAKVGTICQGCGANYQFDSRVLEVDHINPRSQGGTDAYENLTLLCPPCNKEKRDRYTLIGLQDFNRKQGYMKDESKILMGRASGVRRGRRR